MTYSSNLKYSARKLTISDIVSCFPEEIPQFIPRKIKKIKKNLKFWNDRLVEYHKECLHMDEFHQWFWCRAFIAIYFPLKEMEELKYLEKVLYSYERSISPVQEDGLLSRADIQRAKDYPINQLIECKKKGNKYWALCPFHSENTPSFIINKDNSYHCYGCGKHGDSIQFIQLTQGINFVKAVRYINGI